MLKKLLPNFLTRDKEIVVKFKEIEEENRILLEEIRQLKKLLYDIELDFAARVRNK